MIYVNFSGLFLATPDIIAKRRANFVQICGTLSSRSAAAIPLQPIIGLRCQPMVMSTGYGSDISQWLCQHLCQVRLRQALHRLEPATSKSQSKKHQILKQLANNTETVRHKFK